jgi:prepilin-type N-terminal cleavage/methylation domain-containing protein
MTRRSGVTLIEVLVSIFIMGIGMLALLTLFPLGALTMDQAIKADRAGSLARNIYATVAARNIRKDTAYFNPTAATPVDLFRNPNPAGATTWPQFPAGYDGPSYPIYVDPHGILAGAPSTIGAFPTGTPASPGIPRQSVSFVQGAATAAAKTQQALLWFSLLDDMEFDENGLPKSIGNAVQRTNRYTCALLLRRPRMPDTSMVEMAVVVYSSRPLQFSVNEPAYGPVTFDPNSYEVRVSWDPATQERPPVRKGGWIMDATVIDTNSQPAPRGYFYRVVNVTDVAPATAGRAYARTMGCWWPSSM